MSYTIYRVEKDGTRSVVACVDDKREIGVEIYADRDKIDWEPKTYDVEEDYETMGSAGAEGESPTPDAGPTPAASRQGRRATTE